MAEMVLSAVLVIGDGRGLIIDLIPYPLTIAYIYVVATILVVIIV